MSSKFTGERLETSVYNGNTINHLHRYAISLELIKGKTILDIASGEGYGSHLMSLEGGMVYGVDIDEETIERAKNKYIGDNLRFLKGSTSEIPLEANCVDVVISFETLEHHDKHERMMTEIRRVLKPQGTLLISTPDKRYYSDQRSYNNPFHVKELYKPEFLDLISKHFKNTKLYSQSYIYGSSLILEDSCRKEFEFFTGDYVSINNIISNPNYLIAICSDGHLKNIKNSLYEGKDLIERRMWEEKNQNVYNSNSYRLGAFILRPFKFFKQLIKSF